MIYHFIAFSAAVATGAADADCVGYFYKINGVCTGVQQFPGANGCGAANGGKVSHPLSVDRAFCEEFGTARDPADQQVGAVSWGNLGKPGAAEFLGEVDDPSMPSGCVAHSNSNRYQWNTAANGAVAKWWLPVCMTETVATPTAPPSTMIAPSAPPTTPVSQDDTCLNLVNTDFPSLSASFNSQAEACRGLYTPVSPAKTFNDKIFTQDEGHCWAYQINASRNEYRFVLKPYTDADAQLYADPSSSSWGMGNFYETAATTGDLLDGAVCENGAPDCDDSERSGEININALASTSIFPSSWDPATQVFGGTNPAGKGWPVDTTAECKALCDAEPRCTAWQTNLPILDPVWMPQAHCWLYDGNDVDSITRFRDPSKTIMGKKCAGTGNPTVPSMPPTPPPTDATTCDCRQTTATYAEGARCMGPGQTSIGYRKTANWCCSDYGCSKGYKWVNPAANQCHDDEFVGTCMFTFIQNGGCDAERADNDVLMANVDEACFECDHIGELVDLECAGPQTPRHILNNMIEDARRLSGTPLPAGDDELEKINRKISKIRTMLRAKKRLSQAALGRPVIG